MGGRAAEAHAARNDHVDRQRRLHSFAPPRVTCVLVGCCTTRSTAQLSSELEAQQPPTPWWAWSRWGETRPPADQGAAAAAAGAEPDTTAGAHALAAAEEGAAAAAEALPPPALASAECRICHEPDALASLVAPCACRGTGGCAGRAVVARRCACVQPCPPSNARCCVAPARRSGVGAPGLPARVDAPLAAHDVRDLRDKLHGGGAGAPQGAGRGLTRGSTAGVAAPRANAVQVDGSRPRPGQESGYRR